jgi:hypothetical protein
MAFTQSQLVDLLFKKTINFVSNTKPAGVPAANEFYNEPYSSFPFVQSNQIWIQSDQIPTIASTSSVTQMVKVQLSPVTGAVSSGVQYSFYDPTGTLVDIIPPVINSTYALHLYKGDGVTELSTLNNGGYGDMFFDTSSGVLTFYTPSSISLGGNPWIQAYKYVGKKGVIPNLSGLTYSGGTMSIASNLAGSGLTYSNGVLNTLQFVSAGNGLTSSGNTFSASLKQMGGLTFSSGRLSVSIGSGLSVDSNGNLIASGVSFTTGDGLSSGGGTLSVVLDTSSSLTFSSGNISIYSRIAGTGLGFNNGIIYNSAIPISGVGLTNSGNTFSVSIVPNSGLTVSSNGVGLMIGSGLTVSGGLLSTQVNTVAGDGLTASGNTFSVLLNINSGLTFSSSGLSISVGGGMTVSGGQLSLINIPSAGLGLTLSGGTFSTQLQTNSGLTLSLSGIAINPSIAGSGLTYSNGVLSTLITAIAGNGLTANGNTFSVLLNINSGLTVSSQGVSINPNLAGTGLTYSGGVLNSTSYALSGLTNQIAYYVGTGSVLSGTSSISNIYFQGGNSFGANAIFGTKDNYQIQLVTNNTQRLLVATSGNVIIGTNSDLGSLLQINGTVSSLGMKLTNAQITGTSSTYSLLVLNSSTNNVEIAGSYIGSPINMYASTFTFVSGVMQTFTHSLSSSDFIIQMYDSSSGDEVMAAYSGRTMNKVDITAFDSVTARIIIIG